MSDRTVPVNPEAAAPLDLDQPLALVVIGAFRSAVTDGHFQRGYDARASIDDCCRRDDPRDRAMRGSTLRSQLSCLSSEVGAGR